MKRALWPLLFTFLPLTNCATAPHAVTAKRTECLGVSRILNLDEFAGQNFGSVNFQKLPLKPYEVVLTFDDGPNDYATPRILAALENECTKATFFMVGNQILQNPDMAHKILAAGNSIGLHSFSHLHMPQLSAQAQIEDFEQTAKIARQTLGKFDALYRFPFLENSASLLQFMNGKSFHAISIDLDSTDWHANQTSNGILKSIFDGLEKNNHSGIILMHDNQMVEAETLPSTLKMLREKGYKIVLLEASAPK